MKAFLLAAGLGTRLHPITHTIPKCLVPVAGKPLINWWFELLEKNGVNEVLINLHHLPEKVTDHIRSLSLNLKIVFAEEEVLQGSAGTLWTNRSFVAGEKNFFVLYADNLTSVNLNEMKLFHEAGDHPLTMALFTTPRPSQCGIVQLDHQNVVVDFVEKPLHPLSDLANAGMYIMQPEVLELIDGEHLPKDIGFDLLPALVGKMRGWKMNDYLIDIGTHENLQKANEEWPLILRSSATGEI